MGAFRQAQGKESGKHTRIASQWWGGKINIKIKCGWHAPRFTVMQSPQMSAAHCKTMMSASGQT